MEQDRELGLLRGRAGHSGQGHEAAGCPRGEELSSSPAERALGRRAQSVGRDAAALQSPSLLP